MAYQRRRPESETGGQQACRVSMNKQREKVVSKDEEEVVGKSKNTEGEGERERGGGGFTEWEVCRPKEPK